MTALTSSNDSIFEFWWAEYMPEATQDKAWRAWQAAPHAHGVGVASAHDEPVAYWIPKAEQFCLAKPDGRPFLRAWQPLYAAPQHAPMEPAKPLDLIAVDELAKVHSSSYASPHHMTFCVDGLRELIKAAHGIQGAKE